MRLAFSSKLKEDLWRAVTAAFDRGGIVNVPLVAEEVRMLNEVENVAREDIEGLVLLAAQRLGAPIEFDAHLLDDPAGESLAARSSVEPS
jgi:hypothetical protein